MEEPGTVKQGDPEQPLHGEEPLYGEQRREQGCGSDSLMEACSGPGSDTNDFPPRCGGMGPALSLPIFTLYLK